MMDVAAVPMALRRPPILQALGVLEMVSKSEIERLRYEDSREAEPALFISDEKKGLRERLKGYLTRPFQRHRGPS